MSVNALLGFAAFIVFAVVENFFGVVSGLAGGCVVSLLLLGQDLWRDGRTVNVLEAGSAVMFDGLTLVGLTVKADWTVREVRFWVDSGLAVVVLSSIALRRPFTMAHVKKPLRPVPSPSASCLRIHSLMADIWALAFAALAAIDYCMITNPEVPTRRGVLMTIAALVVAAKLTQSYVRRVRTLE